jgi:hypothetical protein
MHQPAGSFFGEYSRKTAHLTVCDVEIFSGVGLPLQPKRYSLNNLHIAFFLLCQSDRDKVIRMS